MLCTRQGAWQAKHITHTCFLEGLWALVQELRFGLSRMTK